MREPKAPQQISHSPLAGRVPSLWTPFLSLHPGPQPGGLCSPPPAPHTGTCSFTRGPRRLFLSSQLSSPGEKG